MSMVNLNPFPVIPDLLGEPLDDGYIYIGNPNQNPESSPKTVYYDAAQTILAAQPIRTAMGRVWNQSSPAALYITGNYSIRVLDKHGAQVFLNMNVSPLG
jgi:hypothetical protein